MSEWFIAVQTLTEEYAALVHTSEMHAAANGDSKSNILNGDNTVIGVILKILGGRMFTHRDFHISFTTEYELVFLELVRSGSAYGPGTNLLARQHYFLSFLSKFERKYPAMIPALICALPTALTLHDLLSGDSPSSPTAAMEAATTPQDMTSIMTRENAKGAACGTPSIGRRGCHDRRALANVLLAQHEAQRAANEARQAALVLQQQSTTQGVAPTVFATGQSIVAPYFPSVPNTTFVTPDASYVRRKNPPITYAQMVQGQTPTQSINQGSNQPPSQPAVSSDHDILAQIKSLGEQIALLTETLTKKK